MEKKKQQQSYENYVRQKTPVHNLPVNMAKAFVTGGVICVIGQGILNICEKAGLGRDMSGSWCSMLLVLLSAVLTGCNLYPQIAKWGGAGALVPITGFANSVAAPAIEYKKEGQDAFYRKGLEYGKRYITGSRRHVYEEIIQFSPCNICPELCDNT